MAYVSVELGSEIVYVAGTINDVETVWKKSGSKWYGYAATSEDGLYHVWIEMYDAAGNRSEFSATLEYKIAGFITDRTEDDVVQRTAKGFLNAVDMNRIERNNSVIGSLTAMLIDAKYDWNIGDLPRESDFTRIQEQVIKIRACARRRDTPPVPERPFNHFQKINDIEKIQQDCYEIYVGSKNNMSYAGEFYAGERGVL